MRYRRGKCDLMYVIEGLLFLTSWIMVVNGSIHEYKDEAFIPRFNSFFFHGGSEGLYASKLHDSPLLLSDDTNNNNNKPINGKSFIRYQFFQYPFDFTVLHLILKIFSCLMNCFLAISRNYFSLVSCRCGCDLKLKTDREQCDSYLFCQDLKRVLITWVMGSECDFTM